MNHAVRSRSRPARLLLSIVLSFGALAAVGREAASATTPSAAGDWSTGFNEARVARGLKRVMECGARLSATFHDLTSRLSAFDSDLGALYDSQATRTYARLRIRSETPTGSPQVIGTIFIPLRPSADQLGSLGHELHHILKLLGPSGRGPRKREELEAKQIARQIIREARKRSGSFCRP